MLPNDLPGICYRIVKQVMRIKKGQVIVIGGNLHNYGSYDKPLCEIPLIEELAINIRKAGAFPILEFSLNNLIKRYFKEIPVEIMEEHTDYYEKWLGYVDGIIDVGWQTTPMLFSQISPEKLLFNRESTLPHILEILKRNCTKVLFLGYPSKEKSKHYNLYTNQFQQAFWNSLEADSHKINLISQKIKETILMCNKMELKALQNEAIKFEVDKKRIEIENGIMEDEFSFLSVPFGEIRIKPKLEAINGKIFFDYVAAQNTTFKDVTLEFEQGKIIDLKTDTSEEVLRKILSFESSENRVIETIGIGLNNKLTYPINFMPYDRKISGSITFNIGVKDKNLDENLFLIECYINNAYLQSENDVLIKNGKLKVI